MGKAPAPVVDVWPAPFAETCPPLWALVPLEPGRVPRPVARRLTETQQAAMDALRKLEVPSRQAAVVRAAGRDRGSVAHALRALVRDGHAERVGDFYSLKGRSDG